MTIFHCACLLFQRRTVTKIPLSKHLFHSIIVFATKRVGEGDNDSLLNHTLTYIQSSSREKLLHLFIFFPFSLLFLIIIIFPFFIPSKFCFNVYMGPCAHLGNVRRNFPRPSNKLGTLRPIFSLKTEKGGK